MGHSLFIIFIAFARLVQSYGIPQGVVHGPVLRRCDNETYGPIYQGNETQPFGRETVPPGTTIGPIITPPPLPYCDENHGFPCATPGYPDPMRSYWSSLNQSLTANATNETAQPTFGPEQTSTPSSAPSDHSDYASSAITSPSENSTATMIMNVTETVGVDSTQTASATGSISSCQFLSGSRCLGPNVPLTSGENPLWGNSSFIPSSTSVSHSNRVFTVLTIDFTPPPESVVATVFVPEPSETASEPSSTLNNATGSSSSLIMTIVTIAVGSNTRTVQTASLDSVSYSSTASQDAGPLNGSTILTVPSSASPTSNGFNSSSTSASSSEVSGALTTGPSAKGTASSSNSSSNENMTSSSPFWSNSTTAAAANLTTASAWLDWNMTAGIMSAWSQYNITFQATATGGNSSESLAGPTMTSGSWNSSVASTFPSTTNSAVLSTDSNSTTSPTSPFSSTNFTSSTETPAITASSNGSTSSWSSVVGPTSLSPNASTICDTNATVAFCTGSNAPWLASETEGPASTTKTNNGTDWSMTSMEATTFTTSFVSASGSGSGDSSANSSSATWHPMFQPHRVGGRSRGRLREREEKRARAISEPHGVSAGHHDRDHGQRKEEGMSWVKAQIKRMFLIL